MKKTSFVATIISGVRVTIPEEHAKFLDLKPGDRVVVTVEKP